MAEKDITQYTKKEFLEMENFGPTGPFDSVIIVPTRKMHESGYRCMKFVLVRHGEIVGVVSGWSDVVHINGIGGYGKDFSNAIRQQSVKPVGWAVDCLPKSGLLRIFCQHECDVDGFIGSDFSFCVR